MLLGVELLFGLVRCVLRVVRCVLCRLFGVFGIVWCLVF